MVKRAYDLYPRIYAFDNLVAAERAAARGKRGRPDVARFEYQLEDELVRLRDALRDETYRPGPYRLYTIREPKERVIAAAPYRDRVVHHALCRVIEPLFERRFIGDAYASRHTNRATSTTTTGFGWCARSTTQRSGQQTHTDAPWRAPAGEAKQC